MQFLSIFHSTTPPESGWRDNWLSNIIILGTGNGRGPGSSPDSIGAGDTLTGCVSTPSSEALDQVSDLRYAKTLPKRIGSVITNNDNASSNGTKVTLSKFSTHFEESVSKIRNESWFYSYFILFCRKTIHSWITITIVIKLFPTAQLQCSMAI